MSASGCHPTPRNYLRVSGEYKHANKYKKSTMELPPRTRRIPALVEGYLQKPGTTSAYAENTPPRGQNDQSAKGTTSAYAENTEGQVTIDFPDAELPPRTRRIRRHHGARPHVQGTTSAYAENTPRVPRSRATRRNYLRVRGEYILSIGSSDE